MSETIFKFEMPLSDAMEFAAFLQLMSLRAAANMANDPIRANLIIRTSKRWQEALFDNHTLEEVREAIKTAEEYF